jgi:hypothetical protein
MSLTYVSNASPQDRFEQITIVLDSGLPGTLVKGFSYDLTPSEAARARQYVVLVDSAATPEPPPDGGQSYGSWKAPIATADDLPASGNTAGDVRLVLSDATVSGALLRYWDGGAWQPLAGGSGGIGPVADFIDIPGALTGITTGQTIGWDGTEFDPAEVA